MLAMRLRLYYTFAFAVFFLFCVVTIHRFWKRSDFDDDIIDVFEKSEGATNAVAVVIERSIVPKKKKLILSWTSFLGILLDDKYFRTCPELRDHCTITVNRSMHAQAEAIVFHPPDMRWNEIPPGRKPAQRYVMLLHESPTSMRTPNLDQIPGFFNWTMTYRMDSDIPYPYWYLVQNSSSRLVLDRQKIFNKSAPVVWFVSKCHTASKREQYVRVLQKYIPVDIYGQCGNKACSKAVDKFGYSMVSDCEKDLIDGKYRFFIAIENSNCKDYITEKFYARWRFNSVPIVLSRKIVEHILPPKSFIALDDFPEGPQKLAEYLKMLMKNDTEYLKYFEWKERGYSETQRHPETGIQWGYCGLCEKLWQLEKEGKIEEKSYQSIKSWWGEQAACDNGLATRLIPKGSK